MPIKKVHQSVTAGVGAPPPVRPPTPWAPSQPPPAVDHRDRGRNRINSCSLPIRDGVIRFDTATSQRINPTYNTTRSRRDPNLAEAKHRDTLVSGMMSQARSDYRWDKEKDRGKE